MHEYMKTKDMKNIHIDAWWYEEYIEHTHECMKTHNIHEVYTLMHEDTNHTQSLYINAWRHRAYTKYTHNTLHC